MKKPAVFSHRKTAPSPSYMGAQVKRPKKHAKALRIVTLIISFALIAGGLYMAYVLLAPTSGILPVKTEIDLNTADDAQDSRNRIQIEKINLEVPFFTGGAEELEKGVWHRFPERGDPVQGGNFILSAHRFRIANNPVLTKVRSPFYNLDKLEVGDTMRVFYEGEWYTYTITKKYSVKPNEVQIEAPTEEPRMTLYSCSLGGSADGRIVLEATTDTPPKPSPDPSPSPTTTTQPKAQAQPKASPQKKPTPEQAQRLREMFRDAAAGLPKPN